MRIDRLWTESAERYFDQFLLASVLKWTESNARLSWVYDSCSCVTRDTVWEYSIWICIVTKPVSVCVSCFFLFLITKVQGNHISDYYRMPAMRHKQNAHSSPNSILNSRQYFFALSRNEEFWFFFALSTKFKCNNNTTKHCKMNRTFILFDFQIQKKTNNSI